MADADRRSHQEDSIFAPEKLCPWPFGMQTYDDRYDGVGQHQTGGKHNLAAFFVFGDPGHLISVLGRLLEALEDEAAVLSLHGQVGGRNGGIYRQVPAKCRPRH